MLEHSGTKHIPWIPHDFDGIGMSRASQHGLKPIGNGRPHPHDHGIIGTYGSAKSVAQAMRGLKILPRPDIMRKRGDADPRSIDALPLLVGPRHLLDARGHADGL